MCKLISRNTCHWIELFIHLLFMVKILTLWWMIVRYCGRACACVVRLFNRILNYIIQQEGNKWKILHHIIDVLKKKLCAIYLVVSSNFRIIRAKFNEFLCRNIYHQSTYGLMIMANIIWVIIFVVVVHIKMVFQNTFKKEWVRERTANLYLPAFELDLLFSVDVHRV